VHIVSAALAQATAAPAEWTFSDRISGTMRLFWSCTAPVSTAQT
jgi:hypothetical protein